ncbi:hypothetical protein K525DRAFT_230835 [Schizophyllum commune Loenen D]|nr:hypothetical protein K525DRAFT_230835 [Schizophyllum commune Loenen D]
MSPNCISNCAQCGQTTVRPLQFDDHAWLPSLRAGNHPSPSESATLEDETRLLKDYVKQIQAEEIKAQQRLAALQFMREKAERDIERRSSYLLSPIRRLPDELLSEIFLHIFPFPTTLKFSGHPPFPTFLRPTYFAPPYVCSWWRDVATRTPKMQPLIEFDLANQAIPRKYAGVDGSVDRLPYAHLRLRMCNILDRTNAPPHPDALASLSTHSARWSELDLSYPSWHVIEHIGTRLQLPQLEQLSLSLPNTGSSMPYYSFEQGQQKSWWDDANASDSPNLFGNAPALRSLGLYNRMGKAITKLPFSLPWQQLTELSVNPHIAAELCVDILDQCTSLQKFALRDNPKRSGWYLTPPATTKTCVFHGTHLAIEVGDLNNAAPFLNALTAPSITHFTFSPFKGKELKPLLNLLDRSQCSVTHLELLTSSPHPLTADLEALLAHTPRLQHLQLRLGDDWQVIEVADRHRGRALLETLCRLRRNGRLSHLQVLKFASPDFYEQHVLTHLIPAFVREEPPLRQFWIETPLKSERIWEELLPELMERVELYGVHDSFELAGPPIVVGEPRTLGDMLLYESREYGSDEDWDDKTDSEGEYDAFGGYF